MKLDQWAGIAEIIGSIAIVASLIFVGVQVDQNTRVTQAMTHQSLIDYNLGSAQLLITNPDILELVTRGKKDPDSLTELERVRFYEFVTLRLILWQAAYLSFQDGLMDAAYYKGYEGYFGDTVKSPGYIAFWHANKKIFIEPFKGYLGALIEKNMVTEGRG